MARLLLDIDTLLSGPLPQVCIVCGCPGTSQVRRKFGAWASSNLVVRTKGKAAVPVCDKHRFHWWVMSLLFSGVMISGLAVWGLVATLGVWLMPQEPGLRVAFGLGGVFGGLICFGLWIGYGASYLRTRHVTAAGFLGNCVILDNVSREFARACTEAHGAAIGH